MEKKFNINGSSKEEKNPFAIPENYFEELPAKILNKCKTELPKSKTIFLFNNSVLAYAASVLIVIGISLTILYFSNENKNITPDNFTGSSTESLLNIADLYGIDENCLIDFLAEKRSEQNIAQNNENDILDYINTNTNNDNEIIELIDY